MKSVNKTKTLAFALFLFGMLALTPAAMAATISTDKADYAPDDVVVISGSGFNTSTVITVSIVGPDGWLGQGQDGLADVDVFDSVDVPGWVISWELIGSDGFTIEYYKGLCQGQFYVYVQDEDGNTAEITFTDAAAHNVNFAASGLPIGVSITVNYSGTNNGGNPQVGSVTFVTPASSANVGTRAGTSFTYGTLNDFPTSVTVGTDTYKLTDKEPASPFMTGVAGGLTTVTATYEKEETTEPLAITAPADKSVEGNAAGGATGVALGTAVASGGTPPYTITNDAPALFLVGLTTVTWTVTDAASGTATDTQTVTVVDTTDPTITAPGDITVEGNATGGATGVVLGSPTVFDLVDPSPVVTNDAPSLFPLGSTVVTWTATDASGNSASAFQTVTVVDTTPPEITDPTDITVEGNTTGGATGVVLVPPTVSDIVDPSPVLTNDAPSFFPLGDTEVTWTATDASGNSATATQTVTVEDTTPPTITAVASLNDLVGAPSSVLPPPTVTDIVDPDPTVTNDAPDFFPAGETIVTWTATDDSGNSATAQTIVTATYNFIGFFSPVDNPGLDPLKPIVNVGKAGRTFPIKWQLKDYNGQFVRDLAVVEGLTYRQVNIGGDPIGDAVTGDTSGASGLRYDSTSEQYIFTWQTSKSFAGKSYEFLLELSDGTVHNALFSFTR